MDTFEPYAPPSPLSTKTTRKSKLGPFNFDSFGKKILDLIEMHDTYSNAETIWGNTLHILFWSLTNQYYWVLKRPNSSIDYILKPLRLLVLYVKHSRIRGLTLLGLGLIKINTVSANFNNPRPSLISNNYRNLQDFSLLRKLRSWHIHIHIYNFFFSLLFVTQARFCTTFSQQRVPKCENKYIAHALKNFSHRKSRQL